MKRILKLLKKYFFPKKAYEIEFPVGWELSDEERAWLFGEDLEDEKHDKSKTDKVTTGKL